MVKVVVKRLHPGHMWRKREGGEMEKWREREGGSEIEKHLSWSFTSRSHLGEQVWQNSSQGGTLSQCPCGHRYQGQKWSLSELVVNTQAKLMGHLSPFQIVFLTGYLLIQWTLALLLNSTAELYVCVTPLECYLENFSPNFNNIDVFYKLNV